MIKIGVCGMGYVGKSVFAYYLAFGSNISSLVGYDINSELINQFNQKGLPEYFSEKQLTSPKYSNDIKDLIGCDYLFLCLPTPDDSGKANLSYINTFLDQYTRLNNYRTKFVVKSTVPIGTCRKLHESYQINIIHYPEFLREGFEKEDCLSPSRTIFGTIDGNRSRIKRDLLLNNECPHFVSVEESESVKYFSNAFLATKITFANSIADFARIYSSRQKIRLDSNKILDLVSKDKRIGPGAFQAGVGFGGPCLPKDIASLRHQMLGIGKKFLSCVIEANEELEDGIVYEILDNIWQKPQINSVLFIGKYFKTGVKDLRGSIQDKIFRRVRDKIHKKIICRQISPEDHEVFEFPKIETLIVNLSDLSKFPKLNKEVLKYNNILNYGKV